MHSDPGRISPSRFPPNDQAFYDLTKASDIEAAFSDAGVLDTDNRLADGMVHVIDTLLLPLDPAAL